MDIKRTNSAMDATTVRFWFHKLGRAKFISHLDLMRAMTRTLRIARLPLWYTEGFHPHLYLTFGQPLSLGFESDCECMEVRFIAPYDWEEAKNKLNALLPPGLQMDRVGPAEPPLEGIAYSEYVVSLSFDAPVEDLAARWQAFAAQETLLTEKKSKKGVLTVDLRPHLQVVFTAAEPDQLVLGLQLPSSQTLHINPTLVTKLFLAFLGRDDCVTQVRKTRVLDSDRNDFAR